MTACEPVAFAIKSLAVGGGAERVFVDVVNGLAERGLSLHVLSFDDPATRAFYPLSGSIPWTRVGTGDATAPARALETLRRMLAARRTVRAISPSLCVAFMHSCYLPLGLSLLATKVPMIASEHIVPEHYARVPIQRYLLRLAPVLAVRITTVSEAARAGYPETLRRKMCVVPNPLTLAAVEPADPVGPPTGRKLLLAVGRLSPQKDFATLIAAFARLAERNPEWDLRIVGEGAERPKLERLIADLGLGSRIALPGATRNIGAEYQAAQLFVLPSRYESQGLAAVEAIAHGLPVVAFADCRGLDAIVEDGVNGRMALEGDRVDGLVEALAPLMADPGRRAALSAPASIDVESVSLPRVLDRWEALIRQHRRGRDPVD